jgi:biuret amidohydrolase
MKTAFGLNIPQTLEDVCDPRRTALLVCDMQVGILSQIKNSKQITSKVLEVLTAALKREFASSSPRRRNLCQEIS